MIEKPKEDRLDERRKSIWGIIMHNTFSHGMLCFFLFVIHISLISSGTHCRVDMICGGASTTDTKSGSSADFWAWRRVVDVMWRRTGHEGSLLIEHGCERPSVALKRAISGFGMTQHVAESKHRRNGQESWLIQPRHKRGLADQTWVSIKHNSINIDYSFFGLWISPRREIILILQLWYCSESSIACDDMPDVSIDAHHGVSHGEEEETELTNHVKYVAEALLTFRQRISTHYSSTTVDVESLFSSVLPAPKQKVWSDRYTRRHICVVRSTY